MTATSLTMQSGAMPAFSQVWQMTTQLLTSEAFAFEPRREPSESLRAISGRLSTLEGLPPGWDSEGGLPVARKHANRSMWFVEHLLSIGDVREPEIVPLADGGVQLEWHIEGRRVDYITDEESDPMILLQDEDGLREISMADVDVASIHALLTPEARGG